MALSHDAPGMETTIHQAMDGNAVGDVGGSVLSNNMYHYNKLETVIHTVNMTGKEASSGFSTGLTALADWMSSLTFGEYQRAAHQHYEHDTCRWFFDEPVVQRLMTSRSGAICCMGKLGVGKTTLVSHLVDLLRSSTIPPNYVKPAAVLFIYCQALVISSLQLFEALLKQVILCCPGLLTIKDQITLDDWRKQDRRPSEEEIRGILSQCFAAAPGICIIVDAVDNLSDDVRHAFLTGVVHLAIDETGRGARLIFTSRPMQSMDEWLPARVHRLQLLAHVGDMKSYIERQKIRNPALKMAFAKNPSQEMDLYLAAQEHRMFSLVKIHLDYILQQPRTDAYTEREEETLRHVRGVVLQAERRMKEAEEWRKEAEDMERNAKKLLAEARAQQQKAEDMERNAKKLLEDAETERKELNGLREELKRREETLAKQEEELSLAKAKIAESNAQQRKQGTYEEMEGTKVDQRMQETKKWADSLHQADRDEERQNDAQVSHDEWVGAPIQELRSASSSPEESSPIAVVFTWPEPDSDVGNHDPDDMLSDEDFLANVEKCSGELEMQSKSKPVIGKKRPISARTLPQPSSKKALSRVPRVFASHEGVLGFQDSITPIQDGVVLEYQPFVEPDVVTDLEDNGHKGVHQVRGKDALRRRVNTTPLLPHRELD